MTQKTRYALAFALLGASLLTVHTQREYSNLTPSDEPKLLLQSGHTYVQTFLAQRRTLACLSLWLEPAVKELPPENLPLLVQTERGQSAEVNLPVAAITRDNPSRVCFSPLLKTTLKEAITFKLIVPESLNEKLRIRQRQIDDSVSADDVHFVVNGTPQPAPLAYQALYRYHPPLILQLGGLALIVAAMLFVPRREIYIAGATILFVLPSLLFEIIPWLLGFYALVALTLSIPYLRKKGLILPAIIVGSSMIAFTTWLPLHLSADYASTPSTRTTPMWHTLRDTFLDSNQIAPSHPYGSYIGAVAAILTLIGLARHGRTYPIPALIGLIGLIALLLPYPLLWHLALLVTLSAAWYAAWGVQTLFVYLGKDRLAYALCVVIALIILLDLWQVAATTQEYSLIH